MKFNRELLGCYLAEFSGTAMLVNLVCITCIPGKQRTVEGTALAIGLVVMICIQCFGFLSQAHINPNVTLMLCILQVIDWKTMLIYFTLQLMGGLLGFSLAFVIKPVYEHITYDTFCLTNPHHELQIYQALILEFTMTSVLLLTVAAVFDPRSKGNDSTSLRLGLVITGLIYIGGEYTGTSLNFVRTIAPHVLQSDYGYVWVYLVAQALAAVCVGVLWRFFFAEKQKTEED